MKLSILSSLCGVAAVVTVFAGSALGDPAKMSRPLDPADFDKAAPACTDFYKFATGGWTDSHPIPAALSRWSAFDQLSENNLADMHAVMDRLVAHPDTSDPDFPRIANYYKACMDEARIDKEGLDWLKKQLGPIDAISSPEQVKAEIARLQGNGIGVFFNFGSSPDGKNSDLEDADLEQGGLSLPNRDFYTRDDDKSKSIRDKLTAHIAKMFVLAGEPEAQAQADSTGVMEVEMGLALASREPADLRDPLKNYNLMPVDQLQALSPDFSWTAFMTDIKAPGVAKIDVGQPDFVKGLGEVLSKGKLASLKAYMKWHVIHSGGNALPQSFVDEEFDFSRAMTGAKELRPRWQRCLRATTAAMPDAVGKAFVKNLVPAGTKERMVKMVRNIRETLREDIQTLDWMSPATKKFATQKLDKMTEHIAYPDHPIDYSALSIAPDVLYGDAAEAVEHFEEHRDLAKIGKPTNHDEWQMSAMITNAYYNPPDNSITFPAGILFPPFFDVKADDAVNYGGIGVVIGHEMTHGFDDEGRNYDEKGNLTDWWTESDAANFAKRGQCIEDEFTGFVAIDDLHENGKLEEGEAIADLGGTTISYRAFQKTPEAKSGKPIDGMTPDQRFYAAFAQIWEQNIRPEQARTQALSDPHPLARFRVIGTIGNLPNFAKAYQCPADSPMVRKDICKIW
jgi:endothelin-converting enzyme/putative endopeptidase